MLHGVLAFHGDVRVEARYDRCNRIPHESIIFGLRRRLILSQSRAEEGGGGRMQ